jgi:hypothetical protein
MRRVLSRFKIKFKVEFFAVKRFNHISRGLLLGRKMRRKVRSGTLDGRRGQGCRAGVIDRVGNVRLTRARASRGPSIVVLDPNGLPISEEK